MTDSGHTPDETGGRRCVSRSPESGTPCALPNTAEAHTAGHQSAYGVGGNAVLRVGWATTEAERDAFREAS